MPELRGEAQQSDADAGGATTRLELPDSLFGFHVPDAVYGGVGALVGDNYGLPASPRACRTMLLNRSRDMRRPYTQAPVTREGTTSLARGKDSTIRTGPE